VSDSTAERTDGVPALKERAGVVNALVDGVQTVLVRSPDLAPRGEDGRFPLYPSYSHQRLDRYDPRHERYYHVSTTKPDAGVPIRATARVVEEFAVESADLEALAPHYVYSADGLRDKYDLGSGGDNVRLLRVAALETPRLIEERGDYRGCRTWIELDESVGLGPATPVLDDAAFEERAAAVRAALGAD